LVREGISLHVRHERAIRNSDRLELTCFSGVEMLTCLWVVDTIEIVEEKGRGRGRLGCTNDTEG
jgi:hypothetical protein